MMIIENNRYQSVECLRKQKYPAGTRGFGDLPPSNLKFPPQIDGFRILYFRIFPFAQTLFFSLNEYPSGLEIAP